MSAPDEWIIPDCGHPIDCADRETQCGDFGPVPVPGPRGEWRCYHIDHGEGGQPIPVWASQQP